MPKFCKYLFKVLSILLFAYISVYVSTSYIFSNINTYANEVTCIEVEKRYFSYHQDLIEKTSSITFPTINSDIIYPTHFNIYSYFTEEEINLLAKLIWSESRGIKSDMHKAAIVWSVTNRITTLYRGCIKDLLYSGAYRKSYKKLPIVDEFKDIAEDVLNRYIQELNGVEDVGRILPKEYIFWYGDGEYNYFRNKYKAPYTVWDWSLDNPYES